MALFDKFDPPLRAVVGDFHGRSLTPRIRPAVDIYRTNSGWLVKIELAGVGKGDVEIVREGRSLTVRGRRRDSFVSQCSQCVSLEISYSEFERRIDLPCDVSQARMEVDARDGMLLIQVFPETAP
jgi:HSP20 family molecular chaperone IbpA